MKLYLNTVDLDDKGTAWLMMIIYKIIRCGWLHSLHWRDSASLNGFHIRLLCRNKCDNCRIVFDDSFRYCADYVNRKPYQRNVVHRSKPYLKGGRQIELKAGEWHHIQAVTVNG